MTVDNTPVVGRFAPTPSGFLHLGNVFCSLLAWLYAKSSGGKIVLRIEDLDPQRCSLAKADALARELEWLGLTWDEGAYCSADSDSFFQSRRCDIYAHCFDLLQQQGLVYPCFCSRSELHAAEAPHASDGRIIYAVLPQADGSTAQRQNAAAPSRLAHQSCRRAYRLYGYALRQAAGQPGARMR